MHSTGGNLADGVALYNYFKSLPIELNFYNGGSIASIATIVFLGAKNRYAGANATFVIHQTHSPRELPATKANRLRALADAYDIDDARTRDILKAHLTLADERLDDHLRNE